MFARVGVEIGDASCERNLRTQEHKPSPRRNLFEIYADILVNCKKPLSRTGIMRASFTSFDSVNTYLLELQRLNFLRPLESRRKYVTTDRGLLFVKKWNALMELLASC